MATHDSYFQRDCPEDEGVADDWSADEFDESDDEIYDCPEDAKPSQGERPSSGGGTESDEIYDLPDDAKVILGSQSDPDHHSTLPDSDQSPSTSGNIDIANLKRRFETAGSGNSQSMNGFSSNSKAAFETYDRPKNRPVASKPRPSVDPKPKVIPPKPLQPRPDAAERSNDPQAATGSNSISRRWPPSREDQENSNIVSTYDMVPVHNEKQRAIATKLSKFLKGSNTMNLSESMAGNNNSLSQNNPTVEQRSVNSNPVAGPPRIDRSTRPNLRKQSTDSPARPEKNALPPNAPVQKNNQVKFEPKPARQNSLTRQVSWPEDEEEDYIEPIAEAEDQYVVPIEGASRNDGFLNYEVPDDTTLKNETQQGQSHEPVPDPPRNRQAIRQSYADIIICPPTKSQVCGKFNDFVNSEATRRSPPMGQWEGKPPEPDINYEVPDQIQTPKRPSRHGPSTHQSGNNTYPGSKQRDSFKAHAPPRPSKDTRPKGRQQFTQPATSNEEVSGLQSDENYEVVEGSAAFTTQNGGMTRAPFNIDKHQNMSGNPVSNRGAVPPLPPPEECQENYEVIGQNNIPVMTEAYEIPSLVDQNPLSGRRCPPEGQENRKLSNSNKKKAFSEEEKMLNQVLTGLTNPQRNKPPAREPMHKDPPPRGPLQRDRPPKDEPPQEPPPREAKRDSMSNRRLPPRPMPGVPDESPVLDLNELQNSVKPQKPSRPGRPLPANEPNNNTSLEVQPWFHGNLGRQQAESKLRSLSKDGCFVVRNTDKVDGYTISIYYQGEIRHIHIFRKQNKYHLGTSDQKFDSVIQLVNHFKINSIDLKKGGTTKLTVTVPSR